MTEVRVTSSTGGAKGVKQARFDLIPVRPLLAVAEHYGKGAEKYTTRDDDGNVIQSGDRNWERGYEWSKSYAALQRHVNAFWGGDDIDAETGSPHLAAVVFHALALMEWGQTHPEFDDRAKKPEWWLRVVNLLAENVHDEDAYFKAADAVADTLGRDDGPTHVEIDASRVEDGLKPIYQMAGNLQPMPFVIGAHIQLGED